ncbi:ATP-binding protein, partial [Corallococcus exiguus]|uniref:ATP-binding protein n=1 Tax=Corallococcus exiguus TaxID=83462 RepID=UPI0017901126
DMLLLAKADHGLLMPSRQALDLATETDALLEYYAPLAEDAGIILRRRGEAQTEGDRHMLRRAMSNLLDNALRFTPPGGTIEVTLSPGLHIEIANPGPAIAAQALPRLFDRFYREDPTRHEGSSEHAGLGLAITRSIVQAHGGGIHAHCEGGWTRFVID